MHDNETGHFTATIAAPGRSRDRITAWENVYDDRY
jgi:hypothetical protein